MTIVSQHLDNLSRLKGGKVKIGRAPAPQYPHSVERDYQAYLLRIVDAIHKDIQREFSAKVQEVVARAQRGDSERLDVRDVSSVATVAGRTVRARMNNTHLRGLVKKIEQYRAATSQHQRIELRKQLRRMIELDAFPAAGSKEAARLRDFLRANVQLIKSLGNDYVEQVEQIMMRGVQMGSRATTIEKDIESRWGVTRSRAMLIARDQINKLRGSLTEVRQTALGIDKYVWRTSRDERVRESHLTKEGKVFAWAKPPGDTGHPGHDIQCRCNAEPFIEWEPPEAEDLDEVVAGVREKRKEMKERLKRKKERAKRKRRVAPKPPPKPRPEPSLPPPKPPTQQAAPEPEPQRRAPPPRGRLYPVERRPGAVDQADYYQGPIRKGMGIADAERAIQGQRVEHCVAYDGLGGQLFRKQGTRDEIKIDKAFMSRMRRQRDVVLTHNHPGKNLGLSEADLDLAAKANMKEIRAVGGRKVWRAIRTVDRWGYTPKDFKEGWNSIDNEVALQKWRRLTRERIAERVRVRRKQTGAPYADLTPREREKISDDTYLETVNELGRRKGFRVEVEYDDQP